MSSPIPAGPETTTRNLQPGSHILDYLGHYHETVPEDTDEASNYDLVLTRDVGGTGRGVAIDARFAGNEARMINDYRGIAAKPNAEFKERETGIMGVYVVVNNGVKGFKGIRKGEEILVSYGRSFWSERKKGSNGVVPVARWR
ncbi:hypothetical protein ABW21_db0206706 [Orbilia brochopaga]|nr:hypothetical protein ABW21_db0206706 [Drechslerella brochopaga]